MARSRKKRNTTQTRTRRPRLGLFLILGGFLLAVLGAVFALRGHSQPDNGRHAPPGGRSGEN